MKFSIDKKVFSHFLKKTQGIIEKNPVIPMASYMKIEAEKEGIIIKATNFEVGIITRCKARVEKEGIFIVDARKIYEIVKEMPEGEIDVEMKDSGWFEISQGKILFNLAGITEEEFPAVEVEEKIDFLDIEAESIEKLIGKTVYATSDDRTRDTLRGILVEGKGSSLRMVATDGHRLSMAEKKLEKEGEVKIAGGTIVPEKGAREMKRLSEEGRGDNIKIGFGERNVVVKREEEMIVVRLIEGDFPDYKRVIPQKNEKKIVVRVGDLMESLRRVMLLTEEETKTVKFEVKKGKMTISSKKSGMGEATEEREVGYEGEDVEFGLNSTYVMDVLGTMGEEEVVLEVLDEKTPVLIKEKGKEGMLSVIMPMIL